MISQKGPLNGIKKSERLWPLSILIVSLQKNILTATKADLSAKIILNGTGILVLYWSLRN